MDTITVFFTPDGYALRPFSRGAPPITLTLKPGVRVIHSGTGQLLAYPPGYIYGIPIWQAITEGWCRHDAAPDEDPQDPHLDPTAANLARG